MKAALIQLDARWEDKKTNLLRAGRLVSRASEEGCDVAVLPEMFSTGFSMDAGKIAEPEDGPAARALAEMATRGNINVIAGFAALGGGKLGRNVAHAYGRDGGLLASYSKMHPFSHAGEHMHYEPGARPVLFNLDGTTASVFICYDLRFPEAMRRVARDVQAIFVIANWPAERTGQWVALLRARAIENQCFVIGLNRTGTDGNALHYDGSSCVFGPMGEELCRATAREEFITCEFDPGEAGRVRAKYPFLKDMKPPSPASL